jgi:tRNA U34 5-methylaminomethyl-2-thiouridine-forming methyltransferase MnmC
LNTKAKWFATSIGEKVERHGAPVSNPARFKQRSPIAPEQRSALLTFRAAKQECAQLCCCYPPVVKSGYRLVRLANGTHSVHSLAHDETFHPVIGPVAEAEALYVRQLRLVERLRSHTGDFVIWDVGLGAAANVLIVLRATRGLECSLRIVSFDQTLEPLRFALKHKDELGYFHGFEPQVTNLLASAPQNPLTRPPGTLSPSDGEREGVRGSSPSDSKRKMACRIAFESGNQSVSWELHQADFPSLLAGPEKLPAPHAILFDAFSPATNPAMWTQPLFADIFRRLDPARPCAMPTYSRSTMLRVSLLLAGFYGGAGHSTGEKEETTIAANSLDLIDEPLDRRWLKRARNSTSAEPLWTPVYRQAPLSEQSWEKLLAHAQFR